MHYILDARTILQWIEVMMTYYYCAGIAPVQFLKQSSHGCLLSLGAGIVGLTSDIEPSHQLVTPRAVRIAVAMLATICTTHFRVSFLVIIYLLPSY